MSGACPAVNVAFEKLASAVHDVNLVIGNNPQAKTYQEGLKYPFRSNAIKSVIAVTSSQCEEGKLLAVSLVIISDKGALIHKKQDIRPKTCYSLCF